MTADDLFVKVKRRAKRIGHDMSEPQYVKFQIHAAIYAFASLNHGGQFHPLYEVLSTSDFEPGSLWTENREVIENEFWPVVCDVCDRLNIA